MEIAIARGRPVPVIKAPDGIQVFRGRYPGSLGDRGEAPYIARLAERVGGIVEVMLPVGRADVANDTTVFEVEPVRSWRKGARQAFSYAGMSGLRPALALFGDFPDRDLLPTFIRVRDGMAPLELWVWTCGRWEQITSRAKASRKIQFEKLN